MSERSKNLAKHVANALNQLCTANLSTAGSVQRLAELIDDYFLDEEYMQSESESSSDEEEVVILSALAGDFVDRYNESDIDIAHPDNVHDVDVHDVDDMPPLALHAVAEAEPERVMMRMSLGLMMMYSVLARMLTLSMQIVIRN